MPRPYELDPQQLEARLDEMVSATFDDLQSQFLILPKGNGFIEFADFQAAYEALKRDTRAAMTGSVESTESAGCGGFIRGPTALS